MTDRYLYMCGWEMTCTESTRSQTWHMAHGSRSDYESDNGLHLQNHDCQAYTYRTMSAKPFVSPTSIPVTCACR
jgi:hypothetical protein